MTEVRKREIPIHKEIRGCDLMLFMSVVFSREDLGTVAQRVQQHNEEAAGE